MPTGAHCMLDIGVPVGAGTTRVASYALRLWTEANTWFSSEAGKKGQIKAGQLADLAVLSADYFSAPQDGCSCWAC
jgi:predicted amidohydrolase YtcJ